MRGCSPGTYGERVRASGLQNGFGIDAAYAIAAPSAPMLDETLTPEELAVVAKAKAFAAEHVAPNAARWEWERRYPLETIKLGCAAGLNAIELAKQHGGQGLRFACK